METERRTAKVVYDGTRTGFIAAAVAYLAENDLDAIDAWFVFDGEVITIDAAMARGEVRQ